MGLLNKGDYVDLIMIDEQEKIVHADVGNPGYLMAGKTDLTGLSLRDLFPDIPEDYPLLTALRTGKGTEHFVRELRAADGRIIKKEGCCYSIFRDGKPVLAFEFSDILYDKVELSDLKRQAENTMYRANNTRYILSDIITRDPAMLALKKRIPEYAASDSNVLIFGKTGTGKELIAQSIHNSSARFHAPFISQNCGAIPENLLEGMLFGTVKGSFTGAEDRPGLFELAEGGSIFLDEINSLSIEMQTKILRVVENKILRRVGSAKERNVDVRVIAATNEDPIRLMEEGRLKRDLFYRLAVLYIKVPDLAEREGDIRELLNYFLDYFNRRTGSAVTIDEDAGRILENYSWPGNVRELRNVIESAFALTEDERIKREDIPAYVIEESFERRRKRPGSGLAEEMDSLEEAIIRRTLSEAGGSRTEAARRLGISKQLLNYRMKRTGKRDDPDRRQRL